MSAPEGLAPPPSQSSATDEPWEGAIDANPAGPQSSPSVRLALRGRATLQSQPVSVRASTTALEPSRLLDSIGSTGLDVTKWSTGSSVVLSMTGEVDIATIPTSMRPERGRVTSGMSPSTNARSKPDTSAPREGGQCRAQTTGPGGETSPRSRPSGYRYRYRYRAQVIEPARVPEPTAPTGQEASSCYRT